MALTFPLSSSVFFDLFSVENSSMELAENQNVTGLASGEPIAVNRMPRLWGGTCRSIPLRHAAAISLKAKLNALGGAVNAFYVYDTRKQYPTYDPDGSIFGAATPIISSLGGNNKSFGITGLPADYELTAGDRFGAVYSTSRRFFGEFSEDVTASGAGAVTSIEISPHLRPGFLAGVSITIIKPECKVKLVPNTAKVNEVDALFSNVSFSFKQTLGLD